MSFTRILVLADTTVAPLANFLNTDSEDIRIEVNIAPYDQVTSILLDDQNMAWKSSPDALLVWTTPEKAFLPFRELLDFKLIDIEELMGEVDNFAQRILRVASFTNLVFVNSWALAPHYRWIQALTMRHNKGISNILMQMNLRLAEKLSDTKNIIILDTQYWYTSVQDVSYDPQLYALGKIHYSRAFFEKVAREVKSILQAVKGFSKKLIICDLDNTLWGGIVGDDGAENLRLGGVDPVGESFVSFQKILKSLRNRGILLAICSKNDENIALGAIATHPEMILRKDDFAAYRINWKDKAENIIEIVNELNLGLQSVVFLDDSPTERERVKRALPEVFTPELPKDFVEYPVFIQSLDCFEALEITKEDYKRTELYIQEKSRKSALQGSESVEDWLNSLNIKVEVSSLSRTDLSRAVQLVNKTNQFNLATRRLSEDELWMWSRQAGNHACTFRVADKFGDLGLIGFITTTVYSDGCAEIIDFVMSCRAMGKKVEDALLATTVKYLKNASVSSIRAEFKRTSKNNPFWEFIRDKYKTDSDFILKDSIIGFPDHIQLIIKENENA